MRLATLLGIVGLIVGLLIGHHFFRKTEEKIVYVEKEVVKKDKVEVKKEIKKPDGTVITKTETREIERRKTKIDSKTEVAKKLNYGFSYQRGNSSEQIMIHRNFLLENVYVGAGYDTKTQEILFGITVLF